MRTCILDLRFDYSTRIDRPSHSECTPAFDWRTCRKSGGTGGRKRCRAAISPGTTLLELRFSISNLGGLGIESVYSILNPPQVAILGVNAIQIKPVRRETESVQFIDAIGLSLTVDHQIMTGPRGARFLLALKEKIEKVESICGI